MKTKTKNKLLKNVDTIMWHDLKLIALKKELELAEAIKMLVNFYKKHNKEKK